MKALLDLRKERLQAFTIPSYRPPAHGKMSERFIARMKSFSTAQSWDQGTLQELIELQGVGALPVSSRRRWCAQCYDDDCFQQHGPYDRILWSVELVSACPVHQVRLEASCGSCGATNLPVLMGVDISGFCPRCRQFLGGRRLSLNGDGDDYARFLLWTSRTVADLLDEPLPIGHDAKGPFPCRHQ
ncbi:TniQ family protein [Roseateles puraquae]|uniref:TniQ family protein n=1 Tax=Roseateles puraquae TaxID=431059 RepID=UPI003CD08ED1